MQLISRFVVGSLLVIAVACGGKSSNLATVQTNGYDIIEPLSMENADVALDSDAVYWLDRAKSGVFRHGFAKGDVAVQIASDIMPQALTSDAEKLYWVAYVDKNLDSIRLQTASKNGTQVTTLVASGLDSKIWPGKPIAAGGGYVYWQKSSNPKAVQRVASTGGDVEDFVGPSEQAKIYDPAMATASATQPLYANGRVYAFLDGSIRSYDATAMTGSTSISGVMYVLDGCAIDDTLYVVGAPDNDMEKNGVWAIRGGAAQLVSLGDSFTRVACSSTTAYFIKMDLASGGLPVSPLQLFEIDATTLQPSLLLKMPESEKSFSSHLAYGGGALAFVSTSGLVRVPLTASK